MKWYGPKGKGRPAARWTDYTGPWKPTISPPHDHEFGIGYDMLYKGIDGKVKARLDGLKPEEAEVLRRKWGL